MLTTWSEIAEELFDANKIAKVFTKGPRCLVGFKLLQTVTINGTPYKKVKGIDIKFKEDKVEVTTDKETITLRIKLMTFASIDKDLNITITNNQ